MGESSPIHLHIRTRQRPWARRRLPRTTTSARHRTGSPSNQAPLIQPYSAGKLQLPANGFVVRVWPKLRVPVHRTAMVVRQTIAKIPFDAVRAKWDPSIVQLLDRATRTREPRRRDHGRRDRVILRFRAPERGSVARLAKARRSRPRPPVSRAAAILDGRTSSARPQREVSPARIG